MGLMMWLLVGGIVIGAIVLLGVIDHFRTPPVCAVCGQKKTIMVERVVEGQKCWMCRECRGA